MKNLFTFSDAVNSTMAFNHASSDRSGRTDARAAVLEAHRELVNIHPWTYLRGMSQIITVAEQTTGTVVYLHTGGGVERQLTLTGATWPAWVKFGVVKIKNINYTVADQISGTVIQLAILSNPGADVASTTYSLFRDKYPLSQDVIQVRGCRNVTDQVWMKYRSPEEFFDRSFYHTSPGKPWNFTLVGDDNYFGFMAIHFYPPPSGVNQFELFYVRRPRELRIDEYSTGLATIAPASLSVSGTGGTNWTSDMIGSLVRISRNNTTLPSGPEGENIAAEERVITAVGSATSLTVDRAWTQTLTAVKYMISDVVDIDQGPMLNAFKRTAEKLVSYRKHAEDYNRIAQVWQSDVRLAMAADSRFMDHAASENPVSQHRTTLLDVKGTVTY